MATRSLVLSRGAWSVELVHPASDEYDVTPSGDATSGMWLGTAPTLFGAPPVMFDERTRVATPGAVITVAAHRPRDIVLPITLRVDDATLEDLEIVAHTIISNVDPLADTDPVRLTYTRPDGTTARWIDADLVAGHDGITIETCEDRSVRFVLVFRAGQPYWSDGVERQVDIDGAIAGDTVAWSDASTAWSATDVFWSGGAVTTGGTTFTGDMPVEPRWELDGPFTAVTISHDGTGEEWAYTGTVAVGETLTVDLRSSSKSVTLDGVNTWQHLAAGSDLWKFGIGAETYTMVFEGEGVGTDVRMYWTPYWLTV